MPPDILFQLANPLALVGWIVLALAPISPRWADRTALGIALVLSASYLALMVVFFPDSDGGYGSLPDVMRLFTAPGVALAGWVHYLAFDLFVGAWQVRKARRDSIPHAFVLPCLLATFLFGPAGLALFFGVRSARAWGTTPPANRTA